MAQAGKVHTVAVVVAFAAALALAVPIAGPQAARAFSESSVGTSSPSAELPPPLPPGAMSVVPAEPKAVAPAPTPRPASRTRSVRKSAGGQAFEVEPADARLKVKEDAWIFTRPSKWSPHIKRAHAGKYVIVTGSTHYYLQVRLKDGETGYIAHSAVDLVKPADKYFKLTRDAPVLDQPNRWGKKIAEVHRPYYVHVTGVSLSYMRIRMKNGLVGFINVSALQ